MAGAATKHRRRRKGDHRQRSLIRAAQRRARQRVSDRDRLQGLDRHRLSLQLRRPDRILARIGYHRRVHAGPRDPRRATGPRQHQGQLPGLARRVLLEPHGFLRHLRSDQAQPEGLRGQDGLRLAADLRRAAQARGEVRLRLLRPDRHVAWRAERRYQLHAPDDRTRSDSTTPTCGARSARSTARRVSCGRRSSTRSRVNGEITPQLHGTLDVGFDLPLPHSSIWLRGAAGAADRRTTPPSRISTLAASATTTSTTARSSATATTTRFPGSGCRRSADSISCAKWSSGTCRRSSSSRPARRPFTRPGCGPRSLPPRW